MKKYADPGKVRLFSFYKLYSDSSVFNGAVNNGFKRVVQEVNESIKNEIKETKNKQENEKGRVGVGVSRKARTRIRFVKRGPRERETC